MEEKKVCISLTDMKGQKVEIPVSDILEISKYDRFVVVMFTVDGRGRYLDVKEEFGEIFLKIAEAFGIGVIKNKRDTMLLSVYGRTSDLTYAVSVHVDDVDCVSLDNNCVSIGVRYYQLTEYARLRTNKDILSFSWEFARYLGYNSESEVQND